MAPSRNAEPGRLDVLLVRHAQASFGSADYDVLSSHGHGQVAALMQDLELHGGQIGRVVSGSYGRSGTTLVSLNEHAQLQRTGGSLLTHR